MTTATAVRVAPIGHRLVTTCPNGHDHSVPSGHEPPALCIVAWCRAELTDWRVTR